VGFWILRFRSSHDPITVLMGLRVPIPKIFFWDFCAQVFCFQWGLRWDFGTSSTEIAVQSGREPGAATFEVESGCRLGPGNDRVLEKLHGKQSPELKTVRPI